MAKIVFVLGAAASLDFDTTDTMPVGSVLAEQIRSHLATEISQARNNPGPIVTTLMQQGGYRDAHSFAMQTIVNNIPFKRSIDDLIREWNDNSDLVIVAKLAIAQCLLHAEQKSVIAYRPSRPGSLPEAPEIANRLHKIRYSWLSTTLQRISPKVPRRNLAEALSQVAFITFNYDRCVETYLYGAFRTIPGLDHRRALEAVSQIPVTHVYGSLSGPPGMSSVPFGASQPSLWQSALGIRTYHETCDTGVIDTIRDQLAAAQRVIFLGFGFHDSNMRILFGDKPQPLGKTFATTVGARPRDLKLIDSWLEKSAAPELSDMECAAFVDRFRDEIFEDLA